MHDANGLFLNANEAATVTDHSGFEHRVQQLEQLLQNEKNLRAEAQLDVALARAQIRGLEEEVKVLRAHIRKDGPAMSKGGLPNGNEGRSIPKELQGDPRKQQQLLTEDNAQEAIIVVTPMDLRYSNAACWVSNELGFAIATYIHNKHHVVLLNPHRYPGPAAPCGAGHNGPILDLSVLRDPSPRLLAIASADETVSVIALHDRNEYCRLRVGEAVNSVLFISDSCLVVGTSYGNIYTYDPKHPNSKRFVGCHPEPVKCLVKLLQQSSHPLMSYCVVVSATAVSVFRPDCSFCAALEIKMESVEEKWIGGAAINEDLALTLVSYTGKESRFYVGYCAVSEANNSSSYDIQFEFTGIDMHVGGRIAWEYDTLHIVDAAKKTSTTYDFRYSPLPRPKKLREEYDMQGVEVVGVYPSPERNGMLGFVTKDAFLIRVFKPRTL